MLVLNELTPPKIHDLEKLFNLCKPFVDGIDAIWIACKFLNKYSVMPRYPDGQETSEGNMRYALRYADAVLNLLRPLYSKDE